MEDLALSWYSAMGSLNAAIASPMRQLANAAGLPIVAAFIFGLIGATSPCQLTTGAGALAFIGRAASSRRALIVRTAGYLLGKAAVYSLLGLAVVAAGQQWVQASTPAMLAVRKLLGPLMIVMGIYMLGFLPVRFSLGGRVSSWIEGRAGDGAAGAFLLGMAFGLAFCPTLFLLFFGLTIPLAIGAPLGLLFPSAFALGTALPLIALSAALVAGRGISPSSSRRLATWIQPVSGAIFLVAGLNDSWLYWLV